MSSIPKDTLEKLIESYSGYSDKELNEIMLSFREEILLAILKGKKDNQLFWTNLIEEIELILAKRRNKDG